MGIEMEEIRVQIKRLTIISIRKGYKLVRNHPFLAGMLLFLFYMYRSFPFMFSLLISTSPVIVCTFALLGLLLSFGEPNIPEIEKEEITSHDIVSLRTDFQRETTVVEKDESFFVERFVSEGGDEVETLVDESTSRNDIVGNFDVGLVSSAPLIEDYFTEIKSEDRDVDVNERKLDETVFLENQYSRIEEMDDENIELRDTKSPVESVDSLVANLGDSLPSSPWKQFGEEEEDDDNEDSDSSSDRAESSSPDASMGDIVPMLDELHPLLNVEAPLDTREFDEEVDHGSVGYRAIPNDSGEESENDKHDDEFKPTMMTWTDDDQKNLMDLDTLELERNQRLESLIARRKARKMMVEKNLIDLNTDLPFNSIAPISTTRRNPFDHTYDSYENSGLPPIPGSAPSVMSQRRNPFDLPYDSSEEKPDLTEDSFKKEFLPFPSKETIYRRHESFNIGSSIFAPPKHLREFRPYFTPEGSSHSSFQRQFSGLSDISKASSLPETESICSIGDENDKMIVEEDLSRDQSELVGHESEFFDDVDTAQLGQVEEREITKISLERSLSTIEEDFPEQAHIDTCEDEVHYSSGSSSSSPTEEHERVFDEKKYEEPIYDLSPSSIQKNLSLDKLVSFSDKQSDLITQSIEMGTDEFSTSGVTLKAEEILDHGFSENEERLDLVVDQYQNHEHEKDHILLEDLNVTALKGEQESVSTEHFSEFHQVRNSLENESIEERSVGEEISLQTNEDQIQSSSWNAYSDCISDEKIVDEIPFSDKAEVESSAVNHEKSTEEPAVFDIADTSFMYLSEVLQETLSSELAESTLDELDNPGEDLGQPLDTRTELSGSQVLELDSIEELEEMKDIDEELLMELDSVGDFSIQNSEPNLNVISHVETREVDDINPIFLMTEPLPMKNEIDLSSSMLEVNENFSQLSEEEIEKSVAVDPLQAEEINSEIMEIDARSINDIDTSFSRINKEVQNLAVFEPIHDKETNTGMREFEAQSLEDTDSVFAQIDEEETEKPVVVDSLDAEVLSEKDKFEVADIETSELPLVEARSIEDIGLVFQQLNNTESDRGSMLKNDKPNDFEVEERAEEINSGMHELNAGSEKEIATAFSQIDEVEKPAFFEPSHDKPEVVESEDKVDEINSGILEFDARSVADIDMAFSQIDEIEKQAIFDPSQDKPDINKSDEINSGILELDARSGAEIDMAFSQINEVEKPAAFDLIQDKLEVIELEDKVDEINSGMLEVDASSIADIDAIFGQIDEVKGQAVFEPIHDEDISSGMKELEAQSFEDIKTAFEQFGEEEMEPSVIVASLGSDLTPEQSETEVSGVEIPESPVVETRSIEDIGLTIEQIDNIDKLGRLVQENDETDIINARYQEEEISSEVLEIDEDKGQAVFEPIHNEDISSGMKELEAQSFEDIKTAFMQFKEEEIEPSVVVASLGRDLTPEQSETEVSGVETPESPVVETRSIEDIGLALKQIDNTEKHGGSALENDETGIINAKYQEEEISSEVLEIDASSIKDIDTAFDQIGKVENPASFEEIHGEEINLRVKELDARPSEDIDLTFRHTNDQNENSVYVKSRIADLSENSEAGISEVETPKSPAVEARSIEDIDISIKHGGIEKSSSLISENDKSISMEAHDESDVALPSMGNIDTSVSQMNQAEQIHLEEVNTEMQELEERSFEDIDSASRKQSIEKVIVNAAVIETSNAEQLSGVKVDEISEMPEFSVDARSSETEDPAKLCPSLNVEMEHERLNSDNDTPDEDTKLQEESDIILHVSGARSLEETDFMEKKLKPDIEEELLNAKLSSASLSEETRPIVEETSVKAQTSCESQISQDFKTVESDIKEPVAVLGSDDLSSSLSDGEDKKKGKSL